MALLNFIEVTPGGGEGANRWYHVSCKRRQEARGKKALGGVRVQSFALNSNEIW